jgi:hypothetical protein
MNYNFLMPHNKKKSEEVKNFFTIIFWIFTIFIVN